MNIIIGCFDVTKTEKFKVSWTQKALDCMAQDGVKEITGCLELSRYNLETLLNHYSLKLSHTDLLHSLQVYVMHEREISKIFNTFLSVYELMEV